MLEEDAPGSVVYELDVPDGIVAKLATYRKAFNSQTVRCARSARCDVLGEEAVGAIAGLDKANTAAT
jgi:O-methyltransferase involved in polyketide biosynthesis